MVAIACDQRRGMRTLLASEPAAQAAITDADLGLVKSDIVQYLGAHASAVLLDPLCAVPGVVRDGTLPRDVGLLISDVPGYDTDANGQRLSRLAKGVTARRVRELAAPAARSWSTSAPTGRRPTATTSTSSVAASTTSAARTCCSWSSS